jgi:hydroxymethylpyrimidine pyrophosphatase-like HAD family hydrolase
MRYFVLASDYDETLAHDSRVNEKTLAALSRLTDSARKVLLVTGRTLDDLLTQFPNARVFERIVAENGAVLYDPATRTRKLLAEPPPGKFVAELTARGVDPLDVGDVIVATREPHEATVLATIRDLGMGHQVIFNKGAVMVLPPGVDKGTGLKAALAELGLSVHNVVGVGDAENDHAFLQLCELAAAVNNALPLVQQRADVVTRGNASQGVTELIDEMVETDLIRFNESVPRHHILLGHRTDGKEVVIPPYGASVLIAGPSGSGKSQSATAFVERLIEHGYQTCLIDPEGDYEDFETIVTVGDTDKAPNADEVLRLLGMPSSQVAVNLLGVAVGDRPSFFSELLPRLQALRSRTGRPHWIMIDEAHHVLPASWTPAPLTVPQSLGPIVAVTVHPDKVAKSVLESMRWVIAVGSRPDETLAQFARGAGVKVPAVDENIELADGEVLVWAADCAEPPFRVKVAPAAMVHRRHRRKYAEGELGPDNSFYFRGAEKKLNLRAHNLATFVELASGVDEATWLFHLRHNDYSRWFREQIKDEELARRAEGVERENRSSAKDSRDAIRSAIEERYTLPT